VNITQEEIDSLCNKVLEAIDYDIFKEDLEERTLLGEVQDIIVANLGLKVVPE
jgi:hypothetical protein